MQELRELWAERIEDFRASGLSQRAWCREHGLRERLGIRKALEKLLLERNYSTPVERMIFAMTETRALKPSSKLYVEHWVHAESFIPGRPEVDVHDL